MVKLLKSLKIGTAAAALAAVLFMGHSVFAADYTVRSGDSLWSISKTYGIGIVDIKRDNNLTGDIIYVNQILKLNNYVSYTVQSGDCLWSISQTFGVSIDDIRRINGLTSDTLYVGQQLKLSGRIGYAVKAGDVLWSVAYSHNVSLQQLIKVNNLKSNTINVGQVLLLPAPTKSAPAPAPAPTPVPAPKAQPVLTWPDVTYIVQQGDTADSISKKFGVSSSDIMKYNYMTQNDWFNAGQKIAITGYAPRQYAITPGEDNAPARLGKLVDWFLDGQYLIKRGDVFLITDVDTGAQFKVKMMGGFNHIDIETLTADDTAVMYKLFSNQWQWAPRAVVIFKDGMNIAASLSGMPHSFDTLPDNNMSGHCDLYLKNSIPHESFVDQAYVKQHYNMVYKAAGQTYN